jgi:restriction endonuclease S subunit
MGRKEPGRTMTVNSVRIQDCAEVRSGFSAKSALGNEPGGTLQVITAQHLNKTEPYRYREQHKLLITPPKFNEKYLVEPGDILFMSRGANNFAVLLEEIPQPAIAPLTCYILKPKSTVVPAYLAWCINQEPVKARLNEMRTGAGTPMIPRREFGEIVIPLPPLATQRRIANLAALQAREKVLMQQLAEETERLQLLTGKRLLSHLTDFEQE